MHLELLWSGWMPLALVAVHRAIERGGISWGLAAGALFAVQTMSSIYYGVYFGTVLLPFAGVLAIGRPHPELRRAAASLACGAVLAAALLLPYLAPYWEAHTRVGERSTAEALLYSAGPSRYLASVPESVVYGDLTAHIGRDEKRLFPGVVAVLLAAVALWPPVTRRRVAYAAALVVAIDLSLGPRGFTYEFLREYLPAYRALRAPARAGGIVLLIIAVLAGFGWARVERVRPTGPRRRRVTAATVLAAIAAEYAIVPMSFVRAPTSPPAVSGWLSTQPPGVVAEFPMPEEHELPGHDAEFAYFSTFHWHPLVNGYSGNVPDSYVELLRDTRSFPAEAALQRLRAADVRYIVVHERLFGSAASRAITADLDTRPALRRYGSFGPQGEAAMVYEMSSRPAHD